MCEPGTTRRHTSETRSGGAAGAGAAAAATTTTTTTTCAEIGRCFLIIVGIWAPLHDLLYKELASYVQVYVGDVNIIKNNNKPFFSSRSKMKSFF